MKICSYPFVDKEGHDNLRALLASGKAYTVTLDGVTLNPAHVFGADEEAGTVELAVLGPTGQLQAHPDHPPQIRVQHGLKKLKKELGKLYIKPKPEVIMSRVLTKTHRGVVKIAVIETENKS